MKKRVVVPLLRKWIIRSGTEVGKGDYLGGRVYPEWMMRQKDAVTFLFRSSALLMASDIKSIGTREDGPSQCRVVRLRMRGM